TWKQLRRPIQWDDSASLKRLPTRFSSWRQTRHHSSLAQFSQSMADTSLSRARQPQTSGALVELSASAVCLDHCAATHHCFAAFFNSCKSPCPACCQYRATEGRRVGHFGQFERGADRVGVNLKPESRVAGSTRNHDSLP